jgi:hypothetical protein
LEKFEVCGLVGWEGKGREMEVSSQERSIKQGRRYPKDVKSRSKPRSRENECGVRIEGWSEVEEVLVKKDHEVGVGDRGGDCWKKNAKTLNLDNFDGLARYGSVQGCALAGLRIESRGLADAHSSHSSRFLTHEVSGDFKPLSLDSVEDAKTSIQP